jgi:hypothetical protein
MEVIGQFHSPAALPPREKVLISFLFFGIAVSNAEMMSMIVNSEIEKGSWYIPMYLSHPFSERTEPKKNVINLSHNNQ